MTLSKKHSRAIVIDDCRFKWLVSPNDGHNVFVAEKEDIKGQKIEVHFNTDINSFWVEFPNVVNLNLKVLKPKDAESIIRQALNDGWNPERKGTPMVFDWENDTIIRRSK
ncbi:hypothetical protein AWW67_15225 [Roseivirga seohaensis]|uniref:Uncharacterized protein n=1 Tax=Roseivirga seohaensis TaxID=1914963 RepID=A0A150Y359_9BACT|nr:hypothetical protein [Roseivirga seohaensis]KYG85479.1 hypothetical protein AWW67_15225 [Roseivirga seohaensis]